MVHTSYSTEEINTLCNGTHLGAKQEVNYLLIDSRSQQFYHNTLFIALIGDRQDGHQYIADAYEKGVRSFLISNQDFVQSNFVEAAFIVVENTLNALQQITRHHRQKFEGNVIAITGSNGKTIVKEWLFQILKDQFNICRSPKSYNSQIGVPLSIWNLNEENNLAIFEAGISAPNEMNILEGMIQPTIGVFTTIGNAHAQNFDSQKQILSEKLLLFKNVATLSYCKDQELVEKTIQNDATFKAKNLICWSRKSEADLRIIAEEEYNNGIKIRGIYKNENIEFEIPFKDQASIENAIHCYLVCLHLNINPKTIAEGMQHLNAVAMRLELKKGIYSCTLINDTYNSDINSIKIAITYLKAQHQHPKHTLILSDILQNSHHPKDVYLEIAQLIKRNKIDRLIGIGNEIKHFKDLFKVESIFFETTDDFLNHIEDLNFFDEAILIKGARKFEFERITNRLQEKAHNTTLEINLSHLIDNFNYYKSILKKDTKLMVMVKAFSYGSGTHEIANILDYYNVDYLAVAYTDEGIALRKQGIKTPILVLNPEPQSFESLIRFDLEPEIFNLRTLKMFIDTIKILDQKAVENKKFPIHLKLDTGMHRLGFEESQLAEAVQLITMEKRIKVVSVFSHLVASDDTQMDNFTQNQFKKFDQMCQFLTQQLGNDFMRHILNSSGILRFPENQYDMVRLGIGLYGIGNVKEDKKQLKPVHRLVAQISQIKQLKKGEFIGYGGKGIMPQDGQIATIPIGYADGISRLLGNGKWRMEINHQLAPTIGSICMDMCMINITNINAKEGDLVVVFGENNDIYELAKAEQTIPYEVLTDIGSRVKRVFYLD